MVKITQLRRCLQLPANATGRDLVVADLHGHRALLERTLDRLGFDPGRDRVLSVGDLIDRGPDSLGTLALIEAPWFHAVLGNHELMLLDHLGCYSSRRQARRPYALGPGQWIAEALAANRKQVSRLADRLAALPLALHVSGPAPFNVMHGDLLALGANQRSLLEDRSICVHQAEIATTSRSNQAAASKLPMLALRFGPHAVQVSPTPLGALPITYVGHSPVDQVMVHNSCVYIDLGVCNRRTGRSSAGALTVIDHQPFAHWLGGVAVARGALAMAPRAPGAPGAADPAGPQPLALA